MRGAVWQIGAGMERSFARWGCLALAALLLGGCGEQSDLDRTVISGEVTYQGQTVEDGLIRFVPVEGTPGPPAGSVIKNGRYEVKASGGVPVGTCRVEIRGLRAVGNANSGGPQVPGLGERRQQYIPQQYNRQSTLKVDIDPDETTTQDFNLE